jgi:hypothetical protein
MSQLRLARVRFRRGESSFDATPGTEPDGAGSISTGGRLKP